MQRRARIALAMRARRTPSRWLANEYKLWGFDRVPPRAQLRNAMARAERHEERFARHDPPTYIDYLRAD